MSKRKEIVKIFPDPSTTYQNPVYGQASAIELTFTRKGIVVFGWYDHFVGIEDAELVAWEEIDSIRKQLYEKEIKA